MLLPQNQGAEVAVHFALVEIGRRAAASKQKQAVSSWQRRGKIDGGLES